jgi:acyl-CoA synthetase (AMP-forming)/AMP-acid ligase II
VSSNATGAPDGAVCNVARFLPEMAVRRPEAVALRVPLGGGGHGGSIRYLDLTFAQLDREVDAWARRLAAAGIRRGMRVLVLVTPGLSLVAVCFALFKAGAVPVVIDPGMGLRGFLRCVGATAPEALVAVRRGVWISRIFREAFAAVRIRVGAGGRRPRAARGAGRVEAFPLAATTAGDPAAILFTSGSTGPAKGVRYTHGMFEAQVRLVRGTYGIAPGEVDLPMLPVFALFNPALGMTTVVPQMHPGRPAKADPAKIVQAIRQCGVTNSFGSPVLWRKIVDHCLSHGIVLPGLRRVLAAGAPVPPGLMADFRRIAPGAVMHSPYGATEALPVATIADREVLGETAEATALGRGTCVGRPVAGVDVRILRMVDGPIATWEEAQVEPAGTIGEIVVRGEAVTAAYDGLDEATAAAKIADPRRGGVWHRMGDAGTLDEQGRLWFCGRKAERVEAAGGVLFTECCEPVFARHRRVARCALIGTSEAGRVEAALVVEPRAGCWPATAAAREAFARELRELGGACAVTRGIRRFFFRRHLPVDVRHNAKIHRLRLAREFAGRAPEVVP